MHDDATVGSEQRSEGLESCSELLEVMGQIFPAVVEGGIENSHGGAFWGPFSDDPLVLPHGEEGRVEVDEGDLSFEVTLEGVESGEVVAVDEAKVGAVAVEALDVVG